MAGAFLLSASDDTHFDNPQRPGEERPIASSAYDNLAQTFENRVKKDRKTAREHVQILRPPIVATKYQKIKDISNRGTTNGRQL